MTPCTAKRVATALILSALNAQAAADGTWTADANGCRIWDPSPKPNESVTWSGACATGYAEGSGTLQWTVDGALSSTFEGILFGGKPYGKGTISYANGNHYEGDFVDGRLTGKGVYAWGNGGRYTGDVTDGRPNGNGTIVFVSGEKYEGDFVNGKRTGRGTYSWPSGERYEGDFVDGKQQGKGIVVTAKGDRYEGDFVNGKRTGKGTYTWVSGDRYEGDFVDGKRTGKGIYIWVSGGRYEGDFVDGKQEGNGVSFMPNGDRYEGAYANGQFDGMGTMQYASGDRYEGSWKTGKYDGMGKYSSRGKPVVEAEFKAGNRIFGTGKVVESAASFDIRICAPHYSQEALDAKEAGIARIQFEIDANGKLLSTTVAKSSGFADLDQATLAALSRCEFKAATKDGKPVASTLTLDYEWKPIPPKVPLILKQLEGDEGVILIDILIVNVKNLDHPEKILKQNANRGYDIRLRNLATNKKYKPKFDRGVGIFIVPEGNYCLDSFTGAAIVDGKRGESFPHWCKGESIKVTKGIINNAGEWWFAQGADTDDDLFHFPYLLIGAYEKSAKTLQDAVNGHAELLED